MTTLREAAQQALEALEDIADAVFSPYDNKLGDAILALRAALAEPVQEPVAWMHTDPDNTFVCFLEWRENEPGYRGDWIKTPLYTAPPQRKPLTDEEISNIWDGHVVPVFGKNGINPFVFARAIERAHGIGSSDVGT